MWATGFLLGNLVGPLAGGGLVAFSLRAPFLVYAVMLVLVVGVTALLLRDRTTVEPPAEVTRPALSFRTALRHRAYRAALVANFGTGWVIYGVRVSLVPLLVVDALRQPPAWSGVALAAFAAGNAVTLVLTGRVADRIGRRPPILLGLAVAGVATGLLGLIAAPMLFLLVNMIAGMGSGMVNPPLNAAVADVVGSAARGGGVLAGFQMAADLGAIGGPVLAGALAEGFGFPIAFVVTGAVAAVGVGFWAGAPETLVRRQPPTPTPIDQSTA
jgi:MFS family permease